MKYRITLLLSLLYALNIFGQENKKDPRYIQYAGGYGSNDGVYLFDDGTFILYGYATAVFGEYKFDKNVLLFYPEKRELFEVYATQNKSLGSDIRINYAGFERGGKTLIRFNNVNAVQKIFNDNPNCFSGPFVSEMQKNVKEFTLYSLADKEFSDMIRPYNAWKYKNDKGYNDFIFVYNQPRREYENFSGIMETNEKGTALKLSNFGGENGYQKYEEKQNQWKELLDMKNSYSKYKEKKEDFIIANKHYSVIPNPDMSVYNYDSGSNQYIGKNIEENAEYYNDNPFSDPRYVRKFSKIQPETRSYSRILEKEILSSTVFFSKCNDASGKSYRYKGLPKSGLEAQYEKIPLTTTPPPPMPPVPVQK
ncbi:TPA: hypothetical protein L3261_000311 [Elizabethkingia anophelis]|nr:hypothetical protein [Elizabethkingia anophelis]HBN6704884.1 hypothetical protein [Elizabethkingia anophelis]HBN6708915.1 hypothetical protein [Elizabethkingia anophelis]HBN6714461.1 hypothetical protein [Elizabethkingia anophelis]HBN6717239.1 hypothetical protein [Elizabethkingia anophelis]